MIQKEKLVDFIRKRPGMYVGDLSINGVYSVLTYFLEDIVPFCEGKTQVTVELKGENHLNINIEGINTSFVSHFVEGLESNRYELDLGLSTMYALSERLEIRTYTGDTILLFNSTKGNYKFTSTASPNKTRKIDIDFEFDRDIFKGVAFNYESLNRFLRKFAFLNSKLRIISIDNTSQIRQLNLFDYPNGLEHLMDQNLDKQPFGSGKPSFQIDRKVRIGNYNYQICLALQCSYLPQTKVMTYANYKEMVWGGSLQIGVMEGFFKSLKKHMAERNWEINSKRLKEDIMILAGVWGGDFNFEGASKTKLGMPQMRQEIKDYMFSETEEYFAKNPEVKKNLTEAYLKV